MQAFMALGCALLLAASAVGCGDDDVGPTPDGGVDSDAGTSPDGNVGADTWRWEAVEPPVDGPLGLWGYVAVPLDDARAVLFDGTTTDAYGRGGVSDAMWMWDASGAAPTFTALHPTGTPPEPRYCGCGAYDPMRQRVLYFGGRDATFASLTDTWELDLGANTWSAVDTSVSGGPSGGVGCALAYAPEVDAFFLFGGGNDATGFSGDTWRYDPAARSWSRLDVVGPSARYDSILRHVADGAPLVLFAGATGAMAGPGFHDDVWLFDPEPPRWQEVPVPGVRPPGRRMPWMVMDEGARGWIAGFGVAGLQATESLGDLWHFDLDARVWSAVDAGEGPGPRGFAGALPAGSSGVGILFGGFDNVSPQAEIWRLIRTGS